MSHLHQLTILARIRSVRRTPISKRLLQRRRPDPRNCDTTSISSDPICSKRRRPPQTNRPPTSSPRTRGSEPMDSRPGTSPRYLQESSNRHFPIPFPVLEGRPQLPTGQRQSKQQQPSPPRRQRGHRRQSPPQIPLHQPATHQHDRNETPRRGHAGFYPPGGSRIGHGSDAGTVRVVSQSTRFERPDAGAVGERGAQQS